MAAELNKAEIQERVEALQAAMRPLEAQLAELRAERDQLLTELRRRERLAQAAQRKDLKSAMRQGSFPAIDELVANTAAGSFDEYVFNLKTGGEVRLGFPLARAQALTMTDGKQVAQARDLGQAHELWAAGWDFGAPGRLGVRVNFPGTRTERLVPPGEVFARPSK